MVKIINSVEVNSKNKWLTRLSSSMRQMFSPSTDLTRAPIATSNSPLISGSIHTWSPYQQTKYSLDQTALFPDGKLLDTTQSGNVVHIPNSCVFKKEYMEKCTIMIWLKLTRGDTHNGKSRSSFTAVQYSGVVLTTISTILKWQSLYEKQTIRIR